MTLANLDAISSFDTCLGSPGITYHPSVPDPHTRFIHPLTQCIRCLVQHYFCHVIHNILLTEFQHTLTLVFCKGSLYHSYISDVQILINPIHDSTSKDDCAHFATSGLWSKSVRIQAPINSFKWGASFFLAFVAISTWTLFAANRTRRSTSIVNLPYMRIWIYHVSSGTIMHMWMLTQVGTIAEISLVFSFRYASSSSNALSLVVASRFDTFLRITSSSAFKWAEEAIGSLSTDGDDDRDGRAIPATEGPANCANPPRSWKLSGLLLVPVSSAARLQVVNGVSIVKRSRS